MKNSIIVKLCYVAVALVFSACRPGAKEAIPAYEFSTYTLFTWDSQSDEFCCKLMTRAESNEFIHAWFPRRNAKCGLANLEATLTQLPKDSLVLWETWPPKNFDYPPEKVVKEVIDFAASRNVHVKQSPALE